MSFLQVGYTLICALFFALLEIQIEGDGGWAKNLPCWRIKNPLRKIIGWKEITGYHVFFWVLFFLFFHFPFFFGFDFNLNNELIILELLFLFLFVEDFFWFVFNPSWGIKKFFKKEIPWHPKKILFFPQNYWIGFLTLLLIDFLRRLAFS
ncbi:MAG: hypothetical protein ABIH88_02555 [Patescibacteria group bacterium]|nr:hypothetical protein [Patescibacteria group bacterium]